MGNWNPSPFGNDTACDWQYGLEDVDDVSLIEAALRAVIDNEDLIEAPEAEEAIAAADTLARLQGYFSIKDEHTEAVDSWVAKNPIEPDRELLALARAVLDRVKREPSELLELWRESKEFREWMDYLERLKTWLR